MLSQNKKQKGEGCSSLVEHLPKVRLGERGKKEKSKRIKNGCEWFDNTDLSVFHAAGKGKGWYQVGMHFRDACTLVLSDFSFV